MLELKNISVKYPDFKIEKFNLHLEANKSYVLYGPSGCGKSTILNVASLFMKPDYGDVIVCGEVNPNVNSKVGRQLLANNIGYMFQNYGLIEHETVYDNLKIIKKLHNTNKKDEIKKVLRELVIEHLIDKKVATLSGGEQQRVAIAKLILKKPSIILCDEPTGNLDEVNSEIVIELLLNLKDENTTILVVSHDKKIAEKFDVIIKL